jgi:hypothetical protein
MNHAISGEIRCYAGGMYESVVTGDTYALKWVEGRMVCKARYVGKNARYKMIRKMINEWGDVEIAILPDDVEAIVAAMEMREEQYKKRKDGEAE